MASTASTARRSARPVARTFATGSGRLAYLRAGRGPARAAGRAREGSDGGRVAGVSPPLTLGSRIGCCCWSGCGGFDGDAEAEAFELGDGAAAALVGVGSVEVVVGAEVVVGVAGVQDVPDGLQEAVSDGDDGAHAS